MRPVVVGLDNEAPQCSVELGECHAWLRRRRIRRDVTRQFCQAARVQRAEKPFDAAAATRLTDLRKDQLRLQLGADLFDMA